MAPSDHGRLPEPAPRTEAGTRALTAVVDDPAGTLVALDFDGTIAPIVDDPEKAYAHQATIDALRRLAPCVGKIAVVTGRPVRTALRLGKFDAYDELSTMSIVGQYGAERWDASTGEITEAPVPAGIAEVREALPSFLADLGLSDVRIEDKGRALVLHTRGLADPAAAEKTLAEPVTKLASDHGLVAEPGKHVIEIRDDSCDKGKVVRGLVEENHSRTAVYGGDDLGDVPAYQALIEMREAGEVEAFLVAVTATEDHALAPHADLIVHSPDELADRLARLAAALGC